MKINVGNDSTKFGIIFFSAFKYYTRFGQKKKKLFKMLVNSSNLIGMDHMVSGYVRIGPTLT